MSDNFLISGCLGLLITFPYKMDTVSEGPISSCLPRGTYNLSMNVYTFGMENPLFCITFMICKFDFSVPKKLPAIAISEQTDASLKLNLISCHDALPFLASSSLCYTYWLNS